MSGYARVVSPSLEDAAAVAVEYDGLDKVAEDDELWEPVLELAAAEPDLRYDFARGLLDIVRRARAFGSDEFLDGDRFTQEVISQLSEPALFHESGVPPREPVVFSDELDPKRMGVTVRRFRYAPLRWTRRVLGLDKDAAARRPNPAVSALWGRPVPAGLDVQRADRQRGQRSL